MPQTHASNSSILSKFTLHTAVRNFQAHCIDNGNAVLRTLAYTTGLLFMIPGLSPTQREPLMSAPKTTIQIQNWSSWKLDHHASTADASVFLMAGLSDSILM
jgi:hypothetical protein